MKMDKFSKNVSVGKPVKMFSVNYFTEKDKRAHHHRKSERETKFASNKIKRNSKSKRSTFNGLKWPKIRHAKEYCENSSIHGFSYFTKKDIHGIERFWWMLSVILSMIGCSLLIRDSYVKWDESPVIVTFSEKMTSIKTIPFPAVTICPEIKSKKEMFNFTDTMLKLDFGLPLLGISEDEMNLLLTNIHVCDRELTFDYSGNFEEKLANETTFDLIKLLAPNMKESIVTCKFLNRYMECEHLFQEIITEDGLCYTFNTLTYEEMFYNNTNFKMKSDTVRGVSGHWSMDDGYDSEADSTDSYLYPFRVLTAGSDVGLTVVLSAREADLDYICSGIAQGFKVTLHSPNELPDVKSKHFRVPFDNAVRISIKPNVIATTKSLENYSPERRQCFFNAERKLRFMKSYTQQNCYLECIANITLKFCGCVQLAMPRSNATPICGVSSFICYRTYELFIWEGIGVIDSHITKCNCLPACSSIGYNAEMSQAKCEFHKYQKAANLSTYPEGLKLVELSIFFKEIQFIPTKRSELIGMTDFVASCGGLLGLFLGISLLSIVELVYYFTIHLFCSSKSKNRVIEKHNDRSEQNEKPPIELIKSSKLYW